MGCPAQGASLLGRACSPWGCARPGASLLGLPPEWGALLGDLHARDDVVFESDRSRGSVHGPYAASEQHY
jgi:hypothetical protein